MPPNKDIRKTALGATESVEWEYYKDSLECIDHLKNKGYEIISVEQANKSTFLDKISYLDSKK